MLNIRAEVFGELESFALKSGIFSHKALGVLFQC